MRRKTSHGCMAASPGQRNERGFVLLVVLSVLGLLAVVAAVFAQVTRTHVKNVAATLEAARAEALADAGAHLAIADIVAARENDAGRRFPLNAGAVACSVEGEQGAI